MNPQNNDQPPIAPPPGGQPPVTPQPDGQPLVVPQPETIPPPATPPQPPVAPAGVPVPPVPPQQPNVPQVQPGFTPPPAKKGMSKGLLWGIIGGAVGLLLLVAISIVLMVMLSGPSKQDYQDAMDKMDNVRVDNLIDEDEFTDADADNLQAVWDKTFDKIDTYNQELGSMPAMRDKEVKAAFGQYIAEYETLKPALIKYTEVAIAYRDYNKACIPSGTLSSLNKSGKQMGQEFDKVYGDCYDAIDNLSKSDNDSLKKLASERTDYLKQQRDYYTKAAERQHSKDYSSPYPSYPSYPDFTDPFEGMDEDISANDLVKRENELYKILSDKARAS